VAIKDSMNEKGAAEGGGEAGRSIMRAILRAGGDFEPHSTMIGVLIGSGECCNLPRVPGRLKVSCVQVNIPNDLYTGS